MGEFSQTGITPLGDIPGFVIESVAGRGGMGVVYRARQLQPERVVALKLISPAYADDPSFRMRFEREAKVAAQIEHPNVIPVYAVGDANGVLFIAMRFVHGTDLRSVIAQDGGLEPRRAATIVDCVAQALDAAHAQGLIHRDVKPANILLATSGGREHVYLTDFGLSRHADASTGVTVTASGDFLGTIDYVSPEQARGERADARTDVYSLGCVLYHALTGTVPFPLPSDMAKLYAHGTQEAPPVHDAAPQVPAEFDAVVRRAMAKSPDDRYLSAGDLGRAALAAAEGTALSRAERSVATGRAAPGAVTQAAPAPTVPGGASVPARARRPAFLLGGLALAAVIVAIVIVAVSGSGGGSKKHSGTAARQPTGTAGIVPGRSIGPVSLGQTRDQVRAALTGLGYKREKDSTATQEFFTSTSAGVYSLTFSGQIVSLIQKFNDPSVKVGGVSIESTLREAEVALPNWHSIRCPKLITLLIAPDGRTYLELPHNLDQNNHVGFNGAAVTSIKADSSFC